MRGKALALIVALCLGSGLGCKRTGQPPAPGAEATPSSSESCAGAEITQGVTNLPPLPGEKPSDGDRLVRRLEAEPATLNPVISNDQSERDVNYYTMESLLDMDLTTGELKPLLAEKWEVAEDKVTFTFHLRHDVTFHDGAPLSADDVIYSIDRIMDPKVDAASLRSYFVDCESYQKLDDYTVVIKWKKPYFKALEMVAGVPIVPKHILDDGTDFNRHPYGRHPVGTGPYKFAAWDTGQKIALERYSGYWGEKPHFDRVQFKIITNDDVGLQVLQKGDLDFIERVRRVQWLTQTVSKEFTDRFTKLHYNYPSYSYIGWNMRNPLFQDKRVRQAMTMLLNRELMLKEIFYCLGRIATGPFYYTTPYADPAIKPYPYDPQQASKLLAEAGWKDSDGDGVLDKDGVPFRFELSFTADVPEWTQMAVMYKEDLKKAGIDMSIRSLEWAVFAENVQRFKFDACALAWTLDPNPDPYQLFHGSQADIEGSSNHVGFKNAEIDRLIELNRAEFDRQKRIEYCRQMDRIIHEEQPYTFFLTGERLSVMDKRIHNIMTFPLRPCLKFNDWYVPAALQKYRELPGP